MTTVRAGHYLALSVPRHRPLTYHGRELHVRDVTDVHGRAFLSGREDDVLYVGEAGYEPLAAYEVLLLVPLDIGPAGVTVVLFERVENVVYREPVRHELPGLYLYLVRLQLAAVCVHLHDAGDGLQLERYVPFQYRAEVHERITLSLHLELVNLAEPRRYRAYLRRPEPLGYRLARGLDPLEYELPGEVDVYTLAERHRHGGKPEP